MNKSLKFDLGELINQGVANSISYSFEADVHFPEIKTLSPVKGSVTIMRLEKSFYVTVNHCEVDVELECTRTLKPFEKHIHFEDASREFFIELPKKIIDINDIFLIDKKRLQIDLTEVIRQEIILHFPAIPVYYQGSNELLDKYTKAQELEHKPLAALKELLK